jgi:hypothetical protein
MFDVNDMAAFAWKDFDRNYAISGHSDITGTWVATKDTVSTATRALSLLSLTQSQPPDWAPRTANRLLTSATVAVETRLFHRTCANSSDGLLCGHVCGGSPLSQATRHVFCIAVGEVRRNEGHMVSMLLTTQHPKTPEGHEVGMQHFDNVSVVSGRYKPSDSRFS